MEILKTRRDVNPPDRPAITKAAFLSGSAFQSAIQQGGINLAQIYDVSRGSNVPASAIVVSTDNSDLPIYLWVNSDSLRWDCAADRIFLNADASGMFSGFSRCRNIDIYPVSSGATRNYANMFYGCEMLRAIDLVSFQMGAAQDVSGMFSGCGSLHKIRYWTGTLPAGAVSTGMFTGCTSIVGGSGTTYDANHTDAEYARLDNPPDYPGYFSRDY